MAKLVKTKKGAKASAKKGSAMKAKARGGSGRKAASASKGRTSGS